MSNSIVSQQNSLSAGELSPSLYGRQDLEKWHSGTSTCRNFFSSYRGGVVSRAGLAYVNTSKQQYPNPPRLIPFQFSLDQGYALEFGDHYLRFVYRGGYILEGSQNILGISQANPGVFDVPLHGYATGDWIFVKSVDGMTDFNLLTWVVNTVIDANHFTVNDLFGNPVDTTGFSAYTGGGHTFRLYEIETPYAVEDLPYLKFTQSADTMTLTCINTFTSTEYIPYNLVRHDAADWVLTAEDYGSTIPAPTGLTASAFSSDIPDTWYSYVVTAIDADTGEESIASDIASIKNNDIAVSLGSNTLKWNEVDNADSYNVYASTPAFSITAPVSSSFGFIGTALGPSFTDNNSIPDFTVVPPVHADPFGVSTIKNVKMITGGANYSQETVSWAITTATGTGFDGFPVIADGAIVGFIITDPGQGYLPSDTIAFSDTGGGIASGSYLVTANVADGDEIFINTVRIVWKDVGSSLGNSEIHRGVTAALSIQSLSNYLNSAPPSNINLTAAFYTYDDNHLYIKYKTPGVDGNSFFLGNSTAGWARSGATLTGGGVVGSGATASLVVSEASGTYPGVATYFQQRRVYAGSLNKPDTYWMSQPGLFTNMDSSIPVTDSDAITGTPWSLQVNGIQFMVPMPGGLVVLTGKGAWQVNGGSQGAAITPSNQNATPQAYNGCHNLVAPIPVNYDILYLQAKGSIIRDLSYNFFTNIYTGTDLTVLSNHLFQDHQIVQWAWCEEPYKLLWLVRDDGIMLCLTYLKEQEVYSWTRHDTQGLFVSVASITESIASVPTSVSVDALYVVTQRHIQGGWRYYVERMNDRLWGNVEDAFCVDSGLSTSPKTPDGTLSPDDLTGDNVAFRVSPGVFTADNVGDVIRVDGGKAVITSYISPFLVYVQITEDLVLTVPNSTRPLPATSNNWSISTPVTVVRKLNHLEGQKVAILADGSVVPSQVVTDGMITLEQPASLISIGKNYDCQVQTLYIDHPDNTGNTVQSRRKTINSVGLMVVGTRGLQIGADQIDASTQPDSATKPWVDMNEVKDRTQFTNAGQAVPLYTGPVFKNVSAGWSVKGQIAIQQVYPLPANILSVISYWKPGDDA